MFLDISEMLKAEREGRFSEYFEAEMKRIAEYDEQRAATAEARFLDYYNLVMRHGTPELAGFVRANAEEIKKNFALPFMECVKAVARRMEERTKVSEDKICVNEQDDV